MTSLVDKKMKMNLNKSKFDLRQKIGPRKETSLAFRLMLNSWRIKYCKDIKCICKKEITLHHLIIECQKMKQHLPTNYKNVTNLKELEFKNWLEIAEYFIKSTLDINL